MATQFHPLPVDVFPKEARTSVARLNRELRDLFGLEGTIASQAFTRRSDKSIVRKGDQQVHISRITPDVSSSTGTAFIDRVTTLPSAPTQVTLIVKAGPPDELYVSLQITGGTWAYIPIVFAP